MVEVGRPERAIENASQDVLGREGFVRRLAAALISAETKKSTGVVVGLTGAWGSGKSSILNLLAEHIRKDHPSALIVRFDPWLVSGRNDLTESFITELLAQMKADSKLKKKLQDLVGTLSDYGEQLAPVGDLWFPGIGTVAKTGFGMFKKKPVSLSALRTTLAKQLAEAGIPIVVLIDEVDRVEDSEIRAIAQLVRAVADFAGISYVLAYDPDRVTQALGVGSPPGQDAMERGRSYLEKIVQLQVPLPAVSDDEIVSMIVQELEKLARELRLPEGFKSIERFSELTAIVVDGIVATPRDVSRLIGSYHALRGMLVGEVDWIDLLGYSVLLTKAPDIVSAIRRDPGLFIAERLSRRDVLREMQDENRGASKLSLALPDAKLSFDMTSLIEMLFPKLASVTTTRANHLDAISQRRPLLTTLRLGLLPGHYTRSDMEALVASEPDVVSETLTKAYSDDSLQHLIDRLEELYPTLPDVDHSRFWQGVARFVRKPDCTWMTYYQPMHAFIRQLGDILLRAVSRDPAKLSGAAAQVFSHLRSQGENVLTAYWLRRHVMALGLYGWKPDDSFVRPFLSESEVVKASEDLNAILRKAHLEGAFIPCRWDLQPLYTIMEMGQWDDECRAVLDRALEDPAAVDGLSLMLFGDHYSTERKTVERFLPVKKYLDAARSRLDDRQSLHETVALAHEKAVEGSMWDRMGGAGADDDPESGSSSPVDKPE